LADLDDRAGVGSVNELAAAEVDADVAQGDDATPKKGGEITLKPWPPLPRLL
jgi:hypothetical protein